MIDEAAEAEVVDEADAAEVACTADQAGLIYLIKLLKVK